MRQIFIPAILRISVNDNVSDEEINALASDITSETDPTLEDILTELIMHVNSVSTNKTAYLDIQGADLWVPESEWSE